MYYATRIDGLNQWIYSVFALLMAAGAFLSFWHGDAEKTAAAVGETWLHRLNADVVPSTHADTEVQDGAAGGT